jgi:hypothetical protein
MKARTGSHPVMIEGNILSAFGPENVDELNTTIIGTEVEIEIANTIAAENTIETVITITMGTQIETNLMAGVKFITRNRDVFS